MANTEMEVLLSLKSDVGGIIGRLDTAEASGKARMDSLESRHIDLHKKVDENHDANSTRINDVEKKQYGILAVASTAGGLCTAFFGKLFEM